MSTVGSVSSESTIPSSGFAFQGLNVNTQAWSTYTMPTPGGWITQLHAYFDAEVASGNGKLVLWDGSGNVITSVAVNSIPVGSNSNGGQAWHHAVLATPVYVKGGVTISIGFWMPGASGFVISSLPSGTSSWNGVGFTGPGNQGGSGSTGIAAIGSFADYTPNKVKIRRSGVWNEAPKSIRRTGANVQGPARWLRRTGAWVRIQ